MSTYLLEMSCFLVSRDRMEPCSLEQARAILKQGFTSHVISRATADRIGATLALEVATRRGQLTLVTKKGDRYLLVDDLDDRGLKFFSVQF